MELLDIFSLQVAIPLLVGVLSALYLHYRKTFSYWTTRGIPQATPLPFIGSFGDMLLRKSIADTDVKFCKKYGRIYGTYDGTKPSIVVADPDLIKLITVKDFNIFTERRTFSTGDEIGDKMLTVLHGDDWRRVRSVVSPSFTSGKMRRMAYLVNENAKTLVRNFQKATHSESTVDCKRYFGAFIMDTIASCAFGTKINSQEEKDHPFVVHAQKLSGTNTSALFILAILLPKLAALFGITFLPKNVKEFFISTTTRIIEERKRIGERGNDFLQLITDARDGKVEKTTEPTNELEGHLDLGSQILHHNNKVLSPEEAWAQCILFFVVGYDTTGSTLTFVAYLLALNPDCQDKLITEVDKIWTENNGKIDFDVVSKMPYLDAVVCETLRMYSFLVRTDRVASEEYVLGDTGITLAKGTPVTIPIYAIHHDPEFYPEPERFDPERFTPENKAARNPYTFIPFGAGPRNCVGMRFALMEAKLCLVNVLRHIQFVRTAKTRVPLTFETGQPFLLPKDLYLKVVKRNT